MKIEMDIPIPAPFQGRNRSGVGALAKAPIGASIFIPTTGRVSSAPFYYGKGWSTQRRVDGGVRIWKIAEPTRNVR